MTQSEQSKKPQPKEVEKVVAPPKSEYDLLIEALKVKKPEVYQQYIKAIEAKKPAWVYPDLTVRIG